MTQQNRPTWDGLPVSREVPYAASIVVWRRVAGAREFLVLPRLAPGGPDYEGDWAWTPPSGARFPSEPLDTAAERELFEETGLRLRITPLPPSLSPSADVALYVAEAAIDESVVLDEEHDRAEWVTLEEALARCLPDIVCTDLARVAAWLDASHPR